MIPTLVLLVYLYFAHKNTCLKIHMYLYRKKIIDSCLVLFSPLLYSFNVWCLLQIYNEKIEWCHTEESHEIGRAHV